MPYHYARLLAALVLLGAALPAQAATIVVTSNADGVAVNGNCTLREAVQAANTNTAVDQCTAGSADGDIVTFLLPGTITLTAGEIAITDDVTIDGGIARMTVNAAGASRIFDVVTASGAGTVERVRFTSLILQNGNSSMGASSAPDAGGAVDLKSGRSATFTNVDVTGSVCGINGGGIHGGTGTDIVITTTGVGTSLIQNNEAKGPESNRGGGGVWGAGTVTITGAVTINGNRASGAAGSGGGVFNLAGTLSIGAGVVISNNAANRAGGGIESADGTVTITDASIFQNTAGAAPGNGGGFHGGGAVQATVSGGSVYSNTAVEGGGLWISAGGTLTVTGTQIAGNMATGADADQGGGGVYSDGGVVQLTGVYIATNRATGAAGSGGGVLNVAGGRMTITDSRIQANSANRAGGGVETNQSGTATGNTLTLVNPMISGNSLGTAPGFGGGVHITGAATATVTGGVVWNNTAVEGGGFWKAASGRLTITGTQILTNIATGAAADQGGGGIYSDGGTGLTVSNAAINGNRASGAAGSGGGFLNNLGATSTFTNTVFSNNAANRAGGAIEDNAGTLLTLTDVTMTVNNAGTAPGNGGGLHISGAGTVVMTGGTVQANTAVEGGGLWKSGPGTLTATGTFINDNTATGAAADQGGGGVYNDGAGGVLTLADLTIANNDARGAAGSGGGLLNNVGATTRITGVTFNANTSVRAGGAIEDNGGALVEILRSTLAYNSTGGAPGNGGAIHITNAGRVTVDSSAVIQNTAANQGGGVWNSGLGQMTVRASTLRDNMAGTGGGVYQVAGPKGLTSVENSLVVANKATAAGGGLAADGATVVVENTTVSGNTADNGGGIASGGGRFLISNATVAGNGATTAGGGIFRITAMGDSLISPDNTIVADNTAPTGADLIGVVMSRGYNLFETTAGATILRDEPAGPDLTGIDPGLEALADNGGATLTRAVGAGSAARSAGMTALLIDQRGYVRLMPSTIGAFEYAATGGPVAGEDAPAGAAAFALGAASPNPMRSRATFRVTAQENEAVEVVLYDMLGRRVQALYAGTPIGPVTVTLDADALAPGVYVVRMTSATAQATQRITVTR